MRAKTQETKLALRRQVRARLKSMNVTQRAAASAQARLLLEKQAVWRNARTVLCYAPLPEELDIWLLVRDSLATGKIVALPRFDPATKQYLACRVQDLDGDIVEGRFNIREPADHCLPAELSRLDLVLVPGMAFDLHGRRLGRGRGFYDQLLAQVSGTTCGVAFDEQIVAEIPVEPHDVHINCILTPTRWIEA